MGNRYVNNLYGFTHRDFLHLRDMIPGGDVVLGETFGATIAMAYTTHRTPGALDKRANFQLYYRSIPSLSLHREEAGAHNCVLHILCLPLEEIPLIISRPPEEYKTIGLLMYRRTGSAIVIWRLDIGK